MPQQDEQLSDMASESCFPVILLPLAPQRVLPAKPEGCAWMHAAAFELPVFRNGAQIV